MKYFKLLFYVICAFLLVLGVSSSVFATIYVKHVEGSLGIKDFRTVQDTISFNISSTSDIVSIGGESASCQKTSFNYYCTITDEVNQPAVEYIILNVEGESSIVTINVDNSIGELVYDVINENGNVTLTYNFADTGYEGGSICAGLLRAEVWWKGSNTDVIDFNSSDCVQTGERVLAITESGNEEFYIDLYDRLETTKQSERRNITIDVSSPQADNLDILNDGISLETISQNTDFLVDITFDVLEDNLSTITADISDITINPALKIPYKNVDVPLSACTFNETNDGKIYSCTISSKVLTINDESVNITINSKDGSGNVETVSLEKSFSIDNTKPEVEITTDYCIEEDCYVKNGINKFNFKLTKDAFEKRNIYFEIGGVVSRVANCSGSECTGIASVSCNSQTSIRILEVAPYVSQDDYGNKIQYYSRTLYCDNSVPQIINTTWGSNSQLAEDLLVSGTALSLIATVDEPDSKIIATAYFDKIKNETREATCEDLEGIFNCTWTISPINDGYYDADVVLTASDIVNNSVTKTLRVRILGFKDSNETPDLLSAKYSRTVPESLNRVTLQLAEFNSIPMYAYAYYSITSKYGSDVELLSQTLSVDTCILRDKRGVASDATYLFSEIKLADTYKKIGDTHRIDFTFGQSAGGYNAFDDGTRVECNVSAYVQKGNYVYKKPQVLTIEIPFKLRNSELGDPGEEYVKKIQEVENSTNSTTSILIANLDKYMVVAQNFCTIKNKLDYAGMTGVAIQLAGMGLSLAGGDTLKVAGGEVVSLVSDVNSVFYDPDAVDDKFLTGAETREPPIMGIIGQACTFMSCNLEWNGKLMLDQGLADSIAESSKKLPLGVGDELTYGLTNSELKNSLVMSVQKLCLPAVVYNLNKYRQVDCEYLECMKVYSASGLDVSQCEVMKSTKTCSIIVGEAFELPYVRIGKNLFSNMADTVRMSYGYGLVKVLKMVEESGVCEDKTSDAAIIACNVPYSIQQYLSSQKKTRMSQDFYYQETRDFCATSQCVGPKCYPSNNLLGIPLPQYVPNSEQQATLNAYQRFGPLASDRYLLLDAYASSDSKVKNQKISDWNKLVTDYNKDHNSNYKTIALNTKETDPTKINDDYNSQISGYFKNFGLPGTTIDAKNTKQGSETVTQYTDPRLNYKKAIDEQLAVQKSIENSGLYIGGVVDKKVSDRVVENNEKIFVVKDYSRLKYNLPYGSGTSIYTNKGLVPTDAKSYYYFDNNLLYYHDEKSGDLKVLEYDADGYPTSVVDYDSLPDDKWGEFKTKAKGLKLKENQQKIDSEKNNYDTKNAAREKAREEYREYMLKQKANVIVGLLMDQLGFKKFLTAEYWADKWGPGEYITEVADALDPEIWKNNLCNPDNGPLYSGEDQPEGTVYSCYNAPGKGCTLVLTYGAEYLDYENNTRLYTITYLVGSVPHDTKFNVLLKGDGTLKGFDDFKKLGAYNYDSKATVILSNREFSEICVSFDGDFPDKGDAKKEFCRPIKKDIFRTGKPVIDKNTIGYPSGNTGSSSGGFFE